MQDKVGNKKYWSKLLHKYRFVVMTDNSFEEKMVVRLSRLSVLSILMIVAVTCFFCTLLLIAYTPLNEYVPGKSSEEVQKKLIQLSLKSDSLKKALDNRGVYLQNIHNILSGEDLVVNPENDTLNIAAEDKKITFEKSTEDSLLRVSVETEDKSSIYIKKSVDHEFLMFFPPVSGLISNVFNSNTRHFGLDLVAKEKTRISSVLDGTVIVSHWAAETGYVIIVQHKNDYLSQYKHNSVLLKKVGDFVLAGEHIAIIGNSGELSSGPHLHFELWHKGVPVNPKDYISF
ncbi:M23 family metallopeptidase [Flavobacteriales bacterium]|nr:M23 family metallopeptidase [Flavobacteriales bacterium]